uniref:Uncharacterized protein n=1 Tax=Solanum tuberosum TaxID=4113 RepID=M1BQN7_SOLTU
MLHVIYFFRRKDNHQSHFIPISERFAPSNNKKEKFVGSGSICCHLSAMTEARSIGPKNFELSQTDHCSQTLKLSKTEHLASHRTKYN